MKTISVARQLRTGILAGLIAAVIYLMIGALYAGGFTTGTIFTGALIIWVITALTTFVIGMLIGGFKRRNRP